MGKISPASPLLGRRESATEGFLISALVIAAIYAGAKVFAPLALAVLLAFALTPPIQLLRRIGVPRVPATLIIIATLLIGAAVAGAILTSQVATLSEDIPKYQRTLKEKIHDLRDAKMASKSMERAGQALSKLQNELAKTEPISAPPEGESSNVSHPSETPLNSDKPTPRAGLQSDGVAPVPVIVRQPEPSALDQIRSVLAVLIEPLASTGLVVVFLVFILLQREDVRNRIIRLLGTKDLQRSTTVLNETGDRLSKFLLAQSIANALFGAAIGTALWFIGIPSPILWGVVAALMRFVPFIGSIISAAFPLILAAAVDPGWSTFGLTALLFIAAELIMGQIIDPLVQGRATGISPLAVIFATVFWTMMWGPMGLVLAVPLTLILVVFGKHIKQLEVFHILLGDEDPLSPAQAFYQRILAGDADEAAEQAERALKDQSFESYLDEVIAPGLGHAARDMERGKVDEVRTQEIDQTVASMLENLETTVETVDGSLPGAPSRQRVYCIRARSDIDTAGARMLAHFLTEKGVDAQLSTEAGITALASGDVVAISDFATANLGSKTNFLIRRIKRKNPRVRIVVGFWTAAGQNNLPKDVADAVVVSSFTEAVSACLDRDLSTDAQAA